MMRDRRARLRSGLLYRIKDRSGRAVPFIPNAAQNALLDRIHSRNVVLKARQLGFSTLIALYLLDDAIFSRNHVNGIVAQDLASAQAIFENVVVFAYEHLPDWMRSRLRARHSTRQELSFARNGSRILVDTSFRGQTLRCLHVSEYAKVSAENPERAREIRTGALNAVPPDGTVFVESTAEGRTGEFAQMVHRASPDETGALDYRLHFFPWHAEPSYRLDDDAPISVETRDYFARLASDPYFLSGKAATPEFSPAQMRWYERKKLEQGDDMEREFPSAPAEAFRATVRGTYYGRELATARADGRIMDALYDPELPVSTAWDLGGAGGGDDTAIWFFQRYAGEIRCVDYDECSGLALGEIVAAVIRKRPYDYDRHILPHDARVREFGSGTTRYDTARSLLGDGVRVLARAAVSDGIEAARRVLGRTRFDLAKCAKGLEHLASYRREYDERHETFSDRPRHDRHSHAADAFRYLASHVEGEGRERTSGGSFVVRYAEW